MNKSNADSIRRQYIKTDIRDKIDGILTWKFDEIQWTREYDNIINRLKDEYGIDISQKDKKTQKTFLKYGVHQNFPVTGDMPKTVSKYIDSLISNTAEDKDKATERVTNALKSVMKTTADNILSGINANDDQQTILRKLKKITKTLVDAIKNKNFNSPLIDRNNQAANEFVSTNGRQTSGVVFNPYSKTRDTTLAANARRESKRALENIANIFEQIETDFVSPSFNGVKQSPLELMKKTIENALTIGKTIDKSQITTQRLRSAIHKVKTEGKLAGFDYETIGNQIQEYALMIGDIDKDNKVFNKNESVSGFVGSMSDEQSKLITNIVENFKHHGTVDSDSEYILKRLWAIGKSDLIKDGNTTGRFYFKDFADVDKANLMEVDVIEKGLKTWINIGKQQREINAELSLDGHSHTYKMRRWEADNLSMLEKAMKDGIPIVAHNGMRFDTSKLLVDILTNGSDGARQYLLDSGVSGIKSYKYFIDSQEAMKAVGSTPLDRQIAEKIANAKTTFNTNESFQIQTGVEKTGQRHMAEVDTEATLNSTVRAIFDENSPLNFNGISEAEPIEIGKGSVFTFNASRGTLNTSNANGLMFSKDSLTGAYRISGPGMSIRKNKDGNYTVNDKDFGSFFQKDTPYAINEIKTYSIKEEEAVGFLKNAITLDSTIAGGNKEIIALELSRVMADGTLSESNPLYLVGSRDTIQTTLSSIGNYLGYADNDETLDKIKMLNEAAAVSANKKPAEKINSRAYSLWKNINSTNKEIGYKSIFGFYDKNKKIETITKDIVEALKENSDIFGFKINSINQLNNLVNAMPMLVRFNKAELFSGFENRLGKGNFDKDRMFSEFYNNIKKNVFSLMQYTLIEDKNEIVPTKEFKESHFEFDLSGAPKSKGVQANFGGDFSNRSVIFDISEGAGANSENWRAAAKLTRIFGLDQNKKAEAVGQYISHLKKHYGIEIDDRKYVNFSADSMINYAVELMRKIRKGTPITEKDENGKDKITGYKTNYKDNAPRAKKIDSTDDNIVLDVIDNLDKDTRDEIFNESFKPVKKYYRSFNEQNVKDAINSYIDNFAVSGFNGIKLANEKSIKDAVEQLTKNSGVSEDLIQVATDNLKNTRATLRDFTLGVVNSIFSFYEDKNKVERVNGDIPLTISENNIILGSITPGEGYILNVSDYIPRIRWNDSTNMPELYIGNIPVINNNVAYKDSKGNMKIGTYFEKVLENSAYKSRLAYLPKIQDDREKLNYIKTILSDIGAELRKSSGLKKTSEELRGIRSFDYSAIYDSVMDAFAGKNNEHTINHFVASTEGHLGEKDLTLWAESFRKNNDKSRPTIMQQAIFKQRLPEIFDIITSDEGLKKEILGDITDDNVGKISGYLHEMDIATRHADRDIGYLDEQESPFEYSGTVHKRQENVAQKRAKTLNKKGLAGTIAKYYSQEDKDQIKQVFSGHMVYSATESVSQREKRYDALTVDTTQTDWQRFIHSEEAKNVLGEEYNRLIEDIDMYIDESNSISNPHLLPLDHSMSVQRIHGENLLPEEQFSLVDGVKSGTKAEIQRRKDLGFSVYFDTTKGGVEKNGGVSLRFAYGNGIYVRKGRNMLTVQAYPQDSKRIKAQGDGILNGRFYETIQGVQTEVSQDRVNEILKEHAVQTRIANAIRDAIRDTGSTEEIQKILQEQVNTILKEKGMKFDYVLKEDTTTTGRKLLLTGEKTYTAYMVSPTGRYSEKIREFFGQLGLGSKYLNVHLSQSFIDNIAYKNKLFNAESSLFINVKKIAKKDHKRDIQEDTEAINEMTSLGENLKIAIGAKEINTSSNSESDIEKQIENIKKEIKDWGAKLKAHSYTISKDGTVKVSKVKIDYDVEAQRRLEQALKNSFGKNAMPIDLQKELMKERTYAWDKGIVPLLQSVFGEDMVNKLSIAAISSTGSDRAKSNHGETDSIVESIGHAAEAYFISKKYSEKDARINARAFINSYILGDGHIDVNTGELTGDYRISTDKIKQNQETIAKIIGGALPSGENSNLAENYNLRLIRDTIVHLSDSDSSVGSLVDKNRGFKYSTRVHTSMSSHRYDEKDIEALSEYYSTKGKVLLTEDLDKNGRMFGAVIDSINEQLMGRGKKVSSDEASDISYIKNIIGVSEDNAKVIRATAEKHGVSIDRAITSYSIRSLALADNFLETQKLSKSENNESIEYISNRKKELAEKFASDHNLEILHISEVSTDKYHTPGNKKSIYNGGNFIIDMGEDERFWMNGQRYIMNVAIPNNIIGDAVESNISVKMQDGIASAVGIYNSYAVRGKDVNYDDVGARKIIPAMKSAANAYTEGLQTMLSGKDSVANLSTKNVLKRSFSSKVRLQRAYKGGAANEVINNFSKEIADTSLYVGKEKAIELLGGEQHIRNLAKESGMSEEKLTDELLKNMSSNGMFVTVKREPTNYTFSVAETRAFYKPSVGKGQTVVGEIIAGMMKADSDGDNISIAPTLIAMGNNGELMSNVEKSVLGIEDKKADSLFQQAEVSSDLLAHSTTARAFRAINDGTTEESKTYGQKLVESVISENGKMSDYSIGGTVIDYRKDVQAYNNLDTDRKRAVNEAFNEFRRLDVFKGHENEVLSANTLISKTNQYIKENGPLTPDLEIGIRAEAAKMIAREKVETDVMQGHAGIVNTHTNKARNLIDELIVRGDTNINTNTNDYRIIQSVLSEIDEKGQAPKNHGEPADLEGIERSFRHLYRNSYEMKTGKLSVADNASEFIGGIEKAIGVENIGSLKRVQQEVYIDGQRDMEKDDLANARRERIVNAFKKLLRENMRVTDSYYNEDSAAYVQKSGHSTPTWANAHVDNNPLKQTVNMASEMSSTLNDGELFHEMNILEKIPEVKRIRQKSEDIQENIDRNIVPGFSERLDPEIISEAEERVSANALKEGTANIIRGIGSSIKSTKGLLGLAGAVMAAGFIGGNPSAPSGTEALQTVQDSQPYEIQSVGNIQPQINQQAPQGYIINVNASSDKGQDYISGLMQQTIRAQFPNQNVSMTMNINDSSSNISFRDVANYLRNAI